MSVPSPAAWPIVGNSLEYKKNPPIYLQHLAKTYGDICRFRLGKHPCFLFSHPDAIREILVTQAKNLGRSMGYEWMKAFLGEGLLTSSGTVHQRRRRLAQPAFRNSRIEAYAPYMVTTTQKWIGAWRYGDTVDIHQEMMRLALTIIGQAMFHENLAKLVVEIGEAVDVFMRYWQSNFSPFAKILHALPLSLNREFEEAKSMFYSRMESIVQNHRELGKDEGDFLSMLLLATDEEGSAALTNREIVEELITITIAGHETTANALSWAWYLLASHRHVAARLEEEVEQVLNGRAPGVQDLEQLPYATAVFKETMRLYPPAWSVGRRAISPIVLADVEVPVGSMIYMSQYVVHRDPRWWPDPDRFEPDRWLAEDQSARPKYSYFPFGAGKHMCIGERFAMLEGILLMALIAQKWRFELVPQQVVTAEAFITLRPKSGIKVKLMARDS